MSVVVKISPTFTDLFHAKHLPLRFQKKLALFIPNHDTDLFAINLINCNMFHQYYTAFQTFLTVLLRKQKSERSINFIISVNWLFRFL